MFLVMNVIGDIKGKNVILIDIDTEDHQQWGRGTLNMGARCVYAACTHPVLSGPAIQRIENSVIESGGNHTIPCPKKRSDKLLPFSGTNFCLLSLESMKTFSISYLIPSTAFSF